MRIALLLLAASLPLAACGGGDDSAADDRLAAGVDTAMTPATGMDSAGAAVTATMQDSAGHDLGQLTLTDATTGIAIAGTLRGLPPGTHAIHLHTTGQCEAPAFQSAGGHWNPTNAQHGTENPQGPHYGDAPNITVGEDSTVTVQVTTPGGMLRGANGLLDADGAAVMIHAGEDDYRTDPAGDAGARIACGVVSGA